MEDEYVQEQQQPVIYPPLRKQENDKTIRWKIDPDDVIQEIAHFLRGDTFNDNTGEWDENKSKKNHRLCNDEGIRTFTTYLRAYLNKNIILSNYDQKMINKVAMENALNVIKLIYTSYDKFDIDKRNFDMILSMIDNNVYATLLRAKEGFFVNHLSTTQRYIEQSSIQTHDKANEKKKIIPNIFGWGGGN